MPICFIEGVSGLSAESRRALVESATRAIHTAYPIPDTRVVIRANPSDHVGQDGVLGAPVRPMCFLEVPPGLQETPRRTLVRALTEAVDQAYGSTDTLIFFREYPLHQVSLNGRLQTENARTSAIVERLEATAR